VGAQHGEAAADLLRQALASAAQRQKSSGAGASPSPSSQESVEDVQDGDGHASMASKRRQPFESAERSSNAAVSAEGQLGGSRNEYAGESNSPSRGEGTGAPEGSPAVGGLSQPAAAPAMPGPQPSPPDAGRTPYRRPTREEDVRGGRCRPGFVPRHGTTADLD
jgi:hypothetical protein